MCLKTRSRYCLLVFILFSFCPHFLSLSVVFSSFYHSTTILCPLPPPSLGAVLTCHQQDGGFIGMQLHLPGDPGPVEVSVPPALLVLGVFVRLARPDERDAEVALLPVQGHLVLPGRDGRGRILLGCLIEWNKKKKEVRHRLQMTAANQESATMFTCSLGSVYGKYVPNSRLVPVCQPVY